MTPIDLIIFDCDGVVIDSEHLALQALVDVLADYGIQMSLEEAISRYAGVSLKDELEDIRIRYQIEIPLDLVDKKAERQKLLFEKNLQAMPGIFDLLDTLPCKKCIASGSPPPRLRHTLGLTKLWDRFAPHIFSAVQVEKGKPAPDIFLYAAKQMGVDPSACLVIEDSVFGIQAALAAAMHVIGFNGGTHCAPGHADKLKAQGIDHVFSSMAEITVALKESRLFPFRKSGHEFRDISPMEI